LVIVVYLITITSIGIYTAKKVKTVGDFFLGGRKFGKFLTAARDFGLGTSTDEPVVVVGKSYSIGLTGVWYTLINMVATPFYWLIRPWFRRLRFFTMSDFCQMRLGSSFGYFYSIFGLLITAITMGLILKGTPQQW
jgi:Na+/proline symporter